MSEAIPAELEKILTSGGYTSADVMAVNPRKGRFCLTAMDPEGKKVFLKWNEPGKEEHYRAFLREKQVYQALAGTGAAPETQKAEGELLVTELMSETGTLRSLMRDPKRRGERQRAIHSAFLKYRAFLKALEENADAFSSLCSTYTAKTQYDRHLRQLYTSGPADAKIRKVERKINGLRLKLARRGGVPVTEIKNPVLIHGDLHLNNFMLTGSGDSENLVLIDFEDVSFGSREIELAYLLSQIEALLRKEPKFFAWCREDFFRVFDGMIDRKEFDSIYVNYRKAVLCNSRFM